MHLNYVKHLPKTRQLSNTLGGKWKNVPFNNVWYDEESDMIVRKVCMCGYDNDDHHHYCSGRYHLYGGSKPGILTFTGKGVTICP